MSLLDRYRTAADWVREFRMDLRVIFHECRRGGLVLLVVVAAVSFWIGVWL